ncbi:MAG: hypothetical protein ACXW3O_11660, partial [Brevundimonas sp.]
MRGAHPRPAHHRPPARGALLSFGQYAQGAAGLAVVIGTLAFTAVRIRSLLVPAWSGPIARVAESVLALSLLTIVLELLGTVGLLSYAPLLIGCWAVAGATELALRRGWVRGREEVVNQSKPGAGPAGPLDHYLKWAVLGMAVLVAAHWAAAVQGSWANGMSGFDTMWYHAPFAARFAQEGSINALHFTDPEYLHWFYPQNSELLHSAGIVLFDNDLLSPLINLGWLGLALLAAWCIGRPYGAAPLTLLAAAVVLDTNTMVPREPGNAANDIATAALLLAAAAVLVEGGRRPPAPLPTGALVVAGLAAGLALGTRLTMAVAVIALTVGVVLLARGSRMRTGAIWIVSVFATGGFWFIRSMGHASGNPFPWLADTISFLPGPDRGLEGRDPFSVAHYLFKLDGGVVGTYFIPDLHGVMGPLWPVVLALAGAGMFAALLRGRSPTVRMLGAVAVAATIGYIFTPLTASGPEGQPDGFAINLRYLAPALALGAVLLPLDRALEAPRRRVALFGLMALTLLTIALYSDAKIAWQNEDAYAPTAVLIGLVVIGVPVGLALLARRRSSAAAWAAGGLAALALLAVGWARQDDYLRDRYGGGFRFHLETAFGWANDVSDSRIALDGTSGAFQQYGLYGRDSSNHVQFVGRPGKDGDFRQIDSCPEWRRAINDGDYDFIVTTPRLDLN